MRPADAPSLNQPFRANRPPVEGVGVEKPPQRRCIVRLTMIALAATTLTPICASAAAQSTVVRVSVTVVESCSATIFGSQVFSPCTDLTATNETRRIGHERMSADYSPPVVSFDQKTSVRTLNF